MSGLPNPVLQQPIRLLDGLWLEVHCCQGTMFLPLRRLALDHGGDRRLGAVVARLRCRQCGSRPKDVALTEHADGGFPGGGGGAGWRVPLP